MSSRLDFRLNGPQFRAFQAVAPGRTVFTGFGRGVGKSWFHRFIWWCFVAKMDGKVREIEADGMIHRRRGVAIGVMMPTLKQFKDVHADGIQEELAADGPWGFLRGKYDKQTGKVTFPGGSTVTPFPAAEHTSKKARGPRVDIGSCDEVDDIPAEVYDAIMVPWMSAPWSLNIQILGGTPTRGRHGLWWRSLEMGRIGERLRNGEEVEGIDPEDAEAFKSVFSFHATYKDAPETVSPAAVAKARATTPRATFEREWEANPDAGEGLVYVFDESFHVRRDVPPLQSFREFHVGMDHGWSDPGCLLLAGIQGHGDDATLWIIDEHYLTETPNHEWDRLAQEWRFATFWPDPSRPDRISDLRRFGLNVGQTDNNILGGIARVASLLHIRETESGERWSRLYVSPRCTNLIREMGLYRRKKRIDGTFDDQPEDKFNHAQDCLRYIAVGRFGRGETRRHLVSGR